MVKNMAILFFMPDLPLQHNVFQFSLLGVGKKRLYLIFFNDRFSAILKLVT